jgi:hypothetical protein
MNSSNEGISAADDAAVVLDMQNPPRLVLKDSAADMEAAAAHAHKVEAAQAANCFSGQAEGVGKHNHNEKQQLSSIYEVFSSRRRGLILGVVSISQFLNPFSSHIILPSLKVILQD